MPADPTNLAAQALGPTRIRVTWTDSSGPNLMFTQVFYSDTNSFGGATFIRGVPAGTQFLDTEGLDPSTPYYFWVRAQDSSNAVSTGPAGSATATTPAKAFDSSNGLAILAQDLMEQFVAQVGGFQNGGSGPLYPLYAEPDLSSPDKAGFINLVEDLEVNHQSRTYFSRLSARLRATAEADAAGAAQALRAYLQPSGGRTGFALPSGRKVLGVQKTSLSQLPLDASGRYQFEVLFDLQMQGNETYI